MTTNNTLLIPSGKPKSVFDNRLASLLASLPDGFKLSYEIADGAIAWSITEKPVDFSAEEEQVLLDNLNALSLELLEPAERPVVDMMELLEKKATNGDLVVAVMPDDLSPGTKAALSQISAHLNHISESAKPNLLSTWKGLGGEKLTPFSGDVDNPNLDGAKAAWLNEMFRATGGMPKNNSLSGFSPSGNSLQAEIAMAYFSLALCGDSTLANKFIKGHRLVPNLHPDYVARTRCYGND